MPKGAAREYDKQFLRDYLLSLKWDQKPPAPDLVPPDIIEKTHQKCEEALKRFTKRLIFKNLNSLTSRRLVAFSDSSEGEECTSGGQPPDHSEKPRNRMRANAISVLDG